MFKIIIYISLCFSLFFTFLSLSFKLFFSYPDKIFNILKLKKYPFIQNIVILSQIFAYKFFGTLNKKVQILVYITILGSGLITLFGVWFRINVLKNVEDYDFMLILVILVIIGINTIFRSFVNFANNIRQSKMFYKLLDKDFFENIKGSKWEQRIAYIKRFRHLK